jgi:hypothetical protein
MERPMVALLCSRLALLLIYGARQGFRARHRRAAQPGFGYVHVDNDGGLRN